MVLKSFAGRPSYPIHWRIVDFLDVVVETLWPRRFSSFTGAVFLIPSLLLVSLLIFGLWDIAESSLHVMDGSTFLPRPEYSLANYKTALGDKSYLLVMGRTLFGAALAVIFTLLLAFPYSYMLVRVESAAARKLLLVILFLPFFIGQVVRAYGMLILLGNEGAFNLLLANFGIEPIRFLFNFPIVVFGLVQSLLPSAVLMLAPALTTIPREVETASESLGATWPRTMLHVVFPMAKPALVSTGLITGILALTDFATPAMLGGGSQDFISNAIYDQFFRTTNQGLGSALAVVLMVVGSTLVCLVAACFGAGALGAASAKK